LEETWPDQAISGAVVSTKLPLHSVILKRLRRTTKNRRNAVFWKF